MKPYVIRGPVAWQGLPDLRDMSHQSKTSVWRYLPIEIPDAALLMNVHTTTVRRWVQKGYLDAVQFFSKSCVHLGGLPQTARCQCIERMFRPDERVLNVLFTVQELQTALHMSESNIMYKKREGEFLTETLPNQHTIRFPMWGFPETVQKRLQNYLDELGTYS